MKKIIVVLVIILMLTSCSTSKSKVINIGLLRVPNDEIIAKQKGYIDEFFKSKGIKVKYSIVDSGVEANKAFASKSLDFATMGNTNGVVALSKKLDTSLVWIHEIIGSTEALVVRESKGIKSIKDLKGKKIATTFSSTSHYILLNVLKEAGIENDVEVIDMLTLDLVAAWERGDIDAAYTWQPGLDRIKQNGGKVLIDSKAMADKGFMTANIGLVRKSFAKENPELVVGLIKALDKAKALYKNNKEEAYKSASKELDLSKEIVKNQMDGSLWVSAKELLDNKYLGTTDKKGNFAKVMADTALFLKKQGSISSAPSQKEFEKFIDTSFIEKAVKK